MKTKNLIILTISFFLLSLIACNSSDNSNDSGESISILKAQDFQSKLESTDGPQLVDVRTPEEYNAGHLSGAKNINYYDKDFNEKVKTLDKDKPVFVYCRSGARSSKVAEILKDAGFSKVYDMKGGITAWNSERLSLDVSQSNSEPKGISLAEYNKITSNNKLVLIDFNAKWCQPCKVLSPILDKVSKDYPEKIKLVKVDIDNNPEIAKELRINAIPALKLYKDGKLVWENLGLLDEKDIKAVISKYF